MTEPTRSGFAFREACIDDLPAVVALLADDAISASRSGHTSTVTAGVLAAFAEIDADPNHQLLLAVVDGDISACLQLSFLPGLSRGGMRRALVESVGVHAKLRGQGVGAALLEEAARRARFRGCGLIQLTTDKRRDAAHRFYARLGYVASHEGMKLLL